MFTKRYKIRIKIRLKLKILLLLTFFKTTYYNNYYYLTIDCTPNKTSWNFKSFFMKERVNFIVATLMTHLITGSFSDQHYYS